MLDTCPQQTVKHSVDEDLAAQMQGLISRVSTLVIYVSNTEQHFVHHILMDEM